MDNHTKLKKIKEIYNNAHKKIDELRRRIANRGNAGQDEIKHQNN
jgi:hypothetical protein